MTAMKKLLLIILSSLIFLNSMVLPLTAHAADQATTAPTGTWYNSNFSDWISKVNDPANPSEIFGERYTAAQVEWVIYGIGAFLLNHTTDTTLVSSCSGSDLVACGKAINDYLEKINKSTSQIRSDKSLVASVFSDRPISGITYTKNLIQKFSLVPEAHAQNVGLGFGFNALTPIQNMWRAFRDIAFGLFVIVAIVFAFMIMFRVKLNPQTVISVQSALPKIIGALVVVTWSYAIAGLLIDLMYIFIGFISLAIPQLIPKSAFITQAFKPSDIFNMLTIGPISKNGAGVEVAGGITGLIGLYLGPLFGIIVIAILITIIAGAALSSTVVAPIIAIVLFLILLVAVVVLLWMAIKTIFGLFKAFANVIMLTIFAPIQLTLGALIPSLGFGQWVKSYLAALSTFVVTGVLAIFSWIFSITAWGYLAIGKTGIDLATTAGGANVGRSPWPPLLGGNGDVGIAMVYAGVAFVMFTLIPKATEIVAGFISGKPFAYGSAIGEAFGPVVSGATMGGNTISSLQAREYANRVSTGKASTTDAIVNGILNGLGTITGGAIKRP